VKKEEILRTCLRGSIDASVLRNSNSEIANLLEQKPLSGRKVVPSTE
jgi:hypothetical protein